MITVARSVFNPENLSLVYGGGYVVAPLGMAKLAFKAFWNF